MKSPNLQTRMIGTLEASVVGLGCNNFGSRIDGQDVATGIVHAALDAGVTYFDTADMYGKGQSEVMLGVALQGRRDEAIIGTKFAMGATNGGSRDYIRSALDGSLERLGVEMIDHYQMHAPDENTPIAETLRALAEVVAEGRVREIGCSNFTEAQLDEMADAAQAEGVAPFATVQNRYSVLTRSPETDGVLDACARHGVGFIPYFPLESGLLTGKIRRGSPPPAGSRLEQWGKGDMGAMFLDEAMVERTEELIAFAEKRGHTILELAMSWLASQPLVTTVISGATSVEQVESNIGAAGWSLSDEELAQIDEIVGAT